METKTIIKAGAVVALVAASAFCVWKAFAIAKEYERREKFEASEKDRLRLSAQQKNIDVEDPKAVLEPLREAPMDAQPPSVGDPKDLMVVEADSKETFDLRDEGSEEEMRFPPDSKEAFNQYVESELADIEETNDTKVAMRRLFYIPFHATEPSDETVVMHVMETRADFFGDDSKWAEGQASIGEVLLYFATQADYDLDGGIDYWLEALTWNCGLNGDDSEQTYRDFSEDISSHTFAKTGKDGMELYGMWLLAPGDVSKPNEDLMQQYWDMCTHIMDEEDA